VKDDFLMDFVAENSNKLQKLGLEGKISWTFNMFTLGPTTHGTLVLLIIIRHLVNKPCHVLW
jgi:hypothetical protein